MFQHFIDKKDQSVICALETSDILTNDVTLKNKNDYNTQKTLSKPLDSRLQLSDVILYFHTMRTICKRLR